MPNQFQSGYQNPIYSQPYGKGTAPVANGAPQGAQKGIDPYHFSAMPEFYSSYDASHSAPTSVASVPNGEQKGNYSQGFKDKVLYIHLRLLDLLVLLLINMLRELNLNLDNLRSNINMAMVCLNNILHHLACMLGDNKAIGTVIPNKLKCVD